jgi:hypothetical protein
MVLLNIQILYAMRSITAACLLRVHFLFRERLKKQKCAFSFKAADTP